MAEQVVESSSSGRLGRAAALMQLRPMFLPVVGRYHARDGATALALQRCFSTTSRGVTTRSPRWRCAAAHPPLLLLPVLHASRRA